MAQDVVSHEVRSHATDEDRSDRPQYYSLKVPLLSSGRRDYLMAESDHLWTHVKVYASGGENDLHAHAAEDHTFVVLAGQATFYDEDGTARVVNQFEGAFIPRGAKYRFLSSAPEPLVMFRVGSGVNGYHMPAPLRMGPDGQLRPPSADPAGRVQVVEIPGRAFGD